MTSDAIGMLALVTDGRLVSELRQQFAELVVRTVYAGVNRFWRFGFFEMADRLRPVAPFTDPASITSSIESASGHPGGWDANLESLADHLAEVIGLLTDDGYQVARVIVVYLSTSAPPPSVFSTTNKLIGQTTTGDFVVISGPNARTAGSRGVPVYFAESFDDPSHQSMHISALQLLTAFLESRDLFPVGSMSLCDLFDQEKL